MTRVKRNDLAAALLLVGCISLYALLSMGHGVLASLSEWRMLSTIFLSIIIEALPFVLLGVIVSSAIGAFLSADHLTRFIPRGRISSHLAAGLLGLVFPVCECGIVPVVRSLVRKGLPSSVGVVVLLATPIVNPVVAVSTYIAFGRHLGMALWRVGLGYLIAVAIGIIFNLRWSGEPPHEHSQAGEADDGPAVLHAHLEAAATDGEEEPAGGWRARAFFDHLGTEFFEIVQFLVIGAFLAAIVQTTLSRSWLAGFSQGVTLSVPAMMCLAYFLSVCSEADAFIAASLRTIFPAVPLLSFMVFGPMLDLKNTIMLAGTFERRFVLRIVIVVGLANLVVFLLLSRFTLGGVIS